MSAAEKIQDTLLRFDAVSKRVGLGRTAIYAGINAGTFPRPVKIGLQSRWSEAEVQAWIDARKAERNGDQTGDQRNAA